jgi:hypothetical protein
VVATLQTAGKPLGVGEVSKALAWESRRTANALASGGQSGVFVFQRDGERLMVTLA